MNNSIESWHSEYELRQFIYMAIRYPIKGVYSGISESQPYSVYTNYIKNSRSNFENFSWQLQNKLSNIENWHAIEIDLNDRFLNMINQYIKWYDEKEDELKIFGDNCHYSIMLNVIMSTKKEIIKYFPNLNDRCEHDEVNNNSTGENEVNVFCKTMPLSLPKELFEKFTTVKNKNGKPFLNKEPQQALNDNPQKIKNLQGKYYALYHWILIELGMEKPFALNLNDKLPKTEIINFASERYKQTSSHMFYRWYKDIDITNKISISHSLGKGYKEVIYSISNNDAKVITHLKKFPN